MLEYLVYFQNFPGVQVLSVGSEDGEKCDCGTQYDYGPNKPYKMKHLIYRNEMFPCAGIILTTCIITT